MSGDQTAGLIYLALILASLGGWALMEYRARLGEMARVALAWGMIFLAVAAGYGLWHDLRSTAFASPQQQVNGQSVTVLRSGDGHYHLNLQINGRDRTMMADTGASGIVLSQADAADLGIDLASLRYLGTANTANGTVRTARVTLASITLGPFQDGPITAYVNQGDMDGSLLGMDYLGRFNIALAGDQMTLTRP